MTTVAYDLELVPKQFRKVAPEFFNRKPAPVPLSPPSFSHELLWVESGTPRRKAGKNHTI